MRQRKQTTASKPTQLTIIHWNCFKLTQQRIDDLRTFLFERRPHIMCLNELKLNEAQCNFHIQFINHTSHFRFRDSLKSNGGGLCILVRSDIVHTQININSNNLELIAINIDIAPKPINIISYYNPKHLSPTIFD